MGNNKIKVGKCGRSIVHNNHLYYDESKRGVQTCFGVNPGSQRAEMFSKVGGMSVEHPDHRDTWPSYGWPGGYDIGYLMDDGELLCGDCMSDPTNPVHFTDENDDNDGWRVVTYMVIEESRELCSHCGRGMGPDDEPTESNGRG